MNRRDAGLVLLAGLLLAALGWALQGVLLALSLSGFVAYLMGPLVNTLERRGVDRWVGAGAAVGCAVLVPLAAALWLGPFLWTELGELVQLVPPLADRLVGEWLPWLQAHSPWPEAVLDLRAWRGVVEQIQPESLGTPFAAVASQLFSTTAGIVGVLVQLALVPLLCFHLLRDAPRIRAAAASVIPADVRPRVLETARQVDRIVSAYLRGQLTVCIVVGALYAGAFHLAGVPFAILVGILAGALTLIPYAGPALGLALAELLVAFEGGIGMPMVWTAIGFGAVQALEGSLITPKIVGDRLGLHPLAVVLGLLAAHQLAGLVGMLVAVPVLAIAKEALWPAVREALARGAPSKPDSGGQAGPEAGGPG
ncbi:MAG: AI-2E family transporter [Myxococcota bacterium]